MRTGHFMSTYSGRRFYPTDPRPSDIFIGDIAHALSNQCRFNGHVRQHYSVAQHSVLCSERVSIVNARWALLHDASEAYLGDVVKPLKLSLPDYVKIESMVMKCICYTFGLPPEEPAEVKLVDRRLCASEARDLLGAEWAESYAETYLDKIVPWTPAIAELRFLIRFREVFQYRRELYETTRTA